jgi:3'-phosphoadenosine 5'-phosphosulfate (PAPS) 3'-phosphatase
MGVNKELSILAERACEAALAAGRVITSYTAGQVVVHYKEGSDSLASQVVTEVDERSQAAILEILAPTLASHDLALLTEELADDGSRFEKDYFWCIDPMDGTLPFTQGKPGYAVAIALIRRDGEPMIGVVYDPVRERLYRAVAGQGLWINEDKWRLPLAESAGDCFYFYVDCTFESDPLRDVMTTQMQGLAQRMGYARSVIEVDGGAVSSACHVLENPPSAYIKPPKPELGGGSFWDFGATACIFQEAGAYARDYAGQRLELNSATHAFFNHCGVCFCSDSALAERVQAELRVIS